MKVDARTFLRNLTGASLALQCHDRDLQPLRAMSLPLADVTLAPVTSSVHSNTSSTSGDALSDWTRELLPPSRRLFVSSSLRASSRDGVLRRACASDKRNRILGFFLLLDDVTTSRESGDALGWGCRRFRSGSDKWRPNFVDFPKEIKRCSFYENKIQKKFSSKKIKTN